MTSLIRCRGAISEMETRFAARADERLAWRAAIWPGEQVIVLTEGIDGSRLHNRIWGLEELAIAEPTRTGLRHCMFARELASLDVSAVSAGRAPCAIVIESAAYPFGPTGKQCRAWTGLWDEPLTLWAGICSETGCAGLLVPANDLVGRVSSHMPLLLTGENRQAWFDSANLGALTAGAPANAWYLEPTDEAWSTGIPAGD